MMISIRATDKLKDRPDEERKVIFLDIDGVLQPTTAQERFNHDMDALKVELAEKYQVSTTTIATAWILRHPAKMQVISGTTSEERLREIVQACSFEISREEWYQLYLAAGHPLP